MCLALTFLVAIVAVIVVAEREHGAPPTIVIANKLGNRQHQQLSATRVDRLLTNAMPYSKLRNRYSRLNLKRLKPNNVYQFKVYCMMQDGIPLMAMRVLSQSNLFVCVADTGSMELNLSGSSCVQCDKGYGHYAHTTQLDEADGQLLVYGTQKDLVKEVEDQVQLHHGGQLYDVPICVTVKRSLAQSNYNVCGLQNTGGRGDVGFLDSILAKRDNLLVRFEHPLGTIAGLKPAAVKRFEQRAPIQVPLVSSRGMGFYMTRIKGIKVGQNPIKTNAQLIIWDTGSNLTSFSRSTFRTLKNKLRTREPVTFVLEGGKEFVIESKNYYWHGTRDLMMDNDLDVLGPDASGYIIMGAYCMQGHQFLFAKDHLTIAPSHLGPIEA